MAITSRNKPKSLSHYKSTHFRYALTYVIITSIVLLFLNIYTSKVNQEMFYNSKKTAMVEKCQMASTELGALDIWNTSTVTKTVSDLGGTKVNRLVVTDKNGQILYDSQGSAGFALFPEITHALTNNDVFRWTYEDGVMCSKAAVPVVSYGSIIGCVYMMEYDTEQGSLLYALQKNTLTITFVLELVVVLFSIIFSTGYARRLRRLMNSMRIIRGGDYTHQVKMGGNDELTVLGEEFNDLLERLQASEQTRRNFVSDASHELKTPLASIKLLSDSILQNEMDQETIREFVSDIGKEADRLTRMTQKLLSLSRIETLEDQECEIVYISPTIHRVTRMLAANAKQNGVELNTDIQQDSPILTMEDDLYQVIFNLVENGIKYNTQGGSLTICLNREEDNAILRIRDTGVGIPEESLSSIFDRFYRVDKARSRKSGGSGLGLAIVRSLVERNGGTIRVESTMGQGSLFEVVFPVFDTEVDTE